MKNPGPAVYSGSDERNGHKHTRPAFAWAESAPAVLLTNALGRPRQNAAIAGSHGKIEEAAGACHPNLHSVTAAARLA